MISQDDYYRFDGDPPEPDPPEEDYWDRSEPPSIDWSDIEAIWRDWDEGQRFERMCRTLQEALPDWTVVLHSPTSPPWAGEYHFSKPEGY